jgi:hypothetical protein
MRIYSYKTVKLSCTAYRVSCAGNRGHRGRLSHRRQCRDHRDSLTYPKFVRQVSRLSFGLDGMCARWLAVYKLDHRLVEGCVLYSSLVLRFPSPASP